MEHWKQIPDLPNYEASSEGNIRHKDAIRKFGNKNRIVSPSGRKFRSDKDGYLRFNVSINGKTITFKVHICVAKTFLPNEKNLPEVNHKNGDKKDNRLDNLEWSSSRGNSIHAVGTLWKGKIKYSRDQVMAVKASRGPAKEVSEITGVSIRDVYRIRDGSRWGHL